MKCLTLALLLCVLASPRVVTAQVENLEDDPVRRMPPVRISIAPLYQRWTQDDVSVSELSIPITAQMRLLPNLGFSVGVSQASAQGDNLEEVSGLTDVQLAVDYTMRFDMYRLVFSLGANVPTGTSQFSDEAYATAALLGLSQFDFRVPFFGQGPGLAPGVAFVAAVTNRLALSAAASYRIRGSFEPISGLQEGYDWGDEIVVSAGAEGQLGKAFTVSVDAIYTVYEADEIGGATVYEPGSRLVAQVQVHKRFGLHDLGLGARYRTADPNEVRAGGIFRPEPVQTFPGLIELSALYSVRLSPAVRTTLYAEGAQYEEDFAFEQMNVIGVGVAPVFSLSPAVTIPIQVKYVFGDLTGLEAGIGIQAIL